MTRQTATITGHRGLDHDEPLIFELDSPGQCGVDFPEAANVRSNLGTLKRETPIGLPGLSEPRVVRHYHRLSRMNYSIDGGFYPLGSCTMKYNPRLNEKLARLPGLGDIHPLQPEATIPRRFRAHGHMCELADDTNRYAGHCTIAWCRCPR